mgnify:CR=1 FL=1
MKMIHTDNAPGAIGPYSQGFIVGDLVYTSGQIPVNPADGTIPEGIAAQAEQSCKNVAAVLEAALRSYQGRALYEGALPEETLARLQGLYGLIY